MWAPKGTHTDSRRTPHGSHLILPRHPSASIRNPHGSHLILLGDPTVSTLSRFPKEGVHLLHCGTKRLVDTVGSSSKMRWLPCGFRMDAEGCLGKMRWLPCGLRVETLWIPKGGRVPRRVSKGAGHAVHARYTASGRHPLPSGGAPGTGGSQGCHSRRNLWWLL